MAELRIGLIGAGGIAGAHARRSAAIPEAEIVAVAAVVPGRAEEFIARNGLAGARAFGDHRALLEAGGCDAVDICTYHRGHHRPAVDALSAGLPVLVEKPLSVDLGEAIEMVRAATRAQRILSVGFQTRYQPNIQAARRLVAEGVLGQLYYAEVGGGRRRGIPATPNKVPPTFISQEAAGGGAVLDIGCYSVDTAMFVLGHPRPLSVLAMTGDHFGRSGKWTGNQMGRWDPAKFEVEDFAAAFVRLSGGIGLVFKIAWAMHLDTLGPTFFLGTEAGLRLDGPVVFRDEHGFLTQTNLTLPAAPRNFDPFREKMRDFVLAVRDGRPAPIPGGQVLLEEAILDGIYRSAAEGREVAIDLPADVLGPAPPEAAGATAPARP